MSVPALLEDALQRADQAAEEVFAADPRVRALGVEQRPDGSYGLVATRCTDTATTWAAPSVRLPLAAAGLPVRVRTVAHSPAVLGRAPVPLASAGHASNIPERRLMRPLCWGVEVQNFDADRRAGVLAHGQSFVGTLGCFVRLRDGSLALLSNNHVLADENHGLPGHDRVLQCASLAFAVHHHAAVLAQFVPIKPWHGPGVVPPLKERNVVDAAVAHVAAGTAWQQAYLSSRPVAPAGTLGFAQPGDRVYKVGRTSELTYGVVQQVGINVGPISYRDGPSYFRRVFTVQGAGHGAFAGPGDSGSAIVRDDGCLVGLLFAGRDDETYACDADSVFAALDCQLA